MRIIAKAKVLFDYTDASNYYQNIASCAESQYIAVQQLVLFCFTNTPREGDIGFYLTFILTGKL